MAMTLEAARVNKKLTQKQAAKLIGISESALRRYEQGKCYPNIPIIQKIEDVYGVAYADIIFLPKVTV